MTEHVLKIEPNYFERVASGEKTFEVRRDDRGFQLGDVLVLKEYDRSLDHECSDPVCSQNRWRGRTVRRRVGFVAKGTLFGLELGEFAILSLLPVDTEGSQP